MECNYGIVVNVVPFIAVQLKSTVAFGYSQVISLAKRVLLLFIHKFINIIFDIEILFFA